MLASDHSLARLIEEQQKSACEPSFGPQQESGGGISKDIKKKTNLQVENMQRSKQSLRYSLVVQQQTNM